MTTETYNLYIFLLARIEMQQNHQKKRSIIIIIMRSIIRNINYCFFVNNPILRALNKKTTRSLQRIQS